MRWKTEMTCTFIYIESMKVRSKHKWSQENPLDKHPVNIHWKLTSCERIIKTCQDKVKTAQQCLKGKFKSQAAKVFHKSEWDAAHFLELIEGKEGDKKKRDKPKKCGARFWSMQQLELRTNKNCALKPNCHGWSPSQARWFISYCQIFRILLSCSLEDAN